MAFVEDHGSVAVAVNLDGGKDSGQKLTDVLYRSAA